MAGAKTRKRKVQVWIHQWDAGTSRRFYLLLYTRPQRGGFWQPVTGGVEEGESFEEAAFREATEETGLVFLNSAPLDLDFEFEFEGQWGPAHERAYALEVAPLGNSSGPSLASVRLDPKEHEAARWVLENDARALLKYPSNVSGLEALLRTLAHATRERNL